MLSLPTQASTLCLPREKRDDRKCQALTLREEELLTLSDQSPVDSSQASPLASTVYDAPKGDLRGYWL